MVLFIAISLGSLDPPVFARSFTLLLFIGEQLFVEKSVQSERCDDELAIFKGLVYFENRKQKSISDL